MKTILTCLLAFSYFAICNAQVSFKKGYYITNNTQKKEGLIKDYDWRSNPEEIEFKITESDTAEKIDITEIKEFVIYNKSRYIKETVAIDISSSNTNELDNNREPIMENRTVLLKTLISGKASLYYYENENLKRFFYANVATPIKQLIYKEYIRDRSKIGENEFYKQQLFNNLKCNSITQKDISIVDYEKKDLVKFFENYNTCTKTNFKNWSEKSNKAKTNLNFRLGVANNNLNYFRNNIPNDVITFDSELSIRLGLELEFVLPFNNHKWAIILEPFYQNYKSTIENTTDEVDYSFIDFSAGLRHYLFLNDKSKLFLNVSGMTGFSLNNTIIETNGSEIEINGVNKYILGFGAGYKYDNKFSIELRINTPRDILWDSVSIESNYNTTSLVLGYTLF